MSNALVVALLALALLGCAGPTSVPASPTVTAQPSPSVVPPSAATPAPAGDTPPAASLAAEGGDPVIGQLGTYTWRDGGSDSPWLPGEPISVGAGEPLSMTLEPAVGVAMWTVRSVPATADGPANAAVLGQGTGITGFPAPAPGTWTVEVRVVFADDLGSAGYFWRLEVS